MRAAVLSRSIAPVVVAVLVGFIAFVSGCPFDDTTPAGAVIICVVDADCPKAQSCDTDAHECVLPGEVLDNAAPVFVEVRFDPPAASSGFVDLVLTADEPLADTPALAFDGVDPGFSGGAPAGAIARFSVDVDDLAEGPYSLRSVEAVDAEGNRAVRLTPATFIVDRRAPRVLALTVSHANVPSSASAFSANAGTSELAISFAIDEAVAFDDVTVTAGTLSSADGGVACSPPGAGNAIVCTATLDALAFTDVSDRVSVSAVDAAGNGGEASIAFPVDLSAPLVVSNELTLLRPGTVTATNVALPGGTLVIDVVASEELSAAPVLTATGDITLGDVAVTSTTPLRWTLRAPILSVGDALARPTLALLVVDRVGNARTVAAGEISIGVAVLSLCPTVSQDPCVDFDGDGDPGVSGSCPFEGGDCDDTNPLTRSDGFEVPGDGIDNDCDGADVPIDESVGVFVDANAAVDGDGTRVAPYKSLSSAIQNIGSRDWFFLATSDIEYATNESWSFSVRGGLDVSTWEHTPGARSRLGLGSAFNGDVVHFENITLDANIAPHVANARLQLSSVRMLDAIDANARLVAVDTRFDRGITLGGTGTGSLVLRSDLLDTVEVRTGRDLTVINSDDAGFAISNGPGFIVSSAARITVVNSRIGDVVCDACAGVRVFHSIVSGDPGDTHLFLRNGGDGLIEVRNSILQWPTASSSSVVFGAPLGRFNANLLDLANARLFVSATGVEARTIDELDNCEPGCLESNGNLLASGGLAFDELHLEIGSAAVDAAVVDSSMPAFVAEDIDGDCRVGGSPDIGVDER